MNKRTFELTHLLRERLAGLTCGRARRSPRQAAAVLPPFPPCHGQQHLRSEDVDAGWNSSGGADVQRAGRRNDEKAAKGMARRPC